VAGGFVWTGFDYRGEPTPLKWPSASSFFGIMDLCGFPKAAYYLHQAHWISDQPVLHLIPHWNWPGKEGKPIRVMALTNADTVTLALNGKVLEEKKVDPIDMVEFQVPYQPGKLEAIGKKNGREIARFAVETTGPPAALEIIPDRRSLAGDGADATPVTIRAVDAKGREVPDANLMVNFETQGPANIIGVGNGDPNCHEPEKYFAKSMPSVKLDDGWKWSVVKDFAEDKMPELQADFDDAKWQSCSIAPERGVLPTGKHGVFRRKITFTADDLTPTKILLSIGTVDDRGILYVNGRRMGEATTWEKPLVADIKPALQEGANVIAVSVFNETHDGGPGKGGSLSFAGKKSSVGWKRSLFNGLAQVIVQSEREGSGTFLLRATAPGLKPAEAPVQITAAAAPPSVENPSTEVLLTNWMQSPVSKQPVDPSITVAENDMNTWTSVQAGTAQDFTGGSWALLRCQFTPAQAIATGGGFIHFKEITGNAEVFVDGVKAGVKSSPAPAALKVPLPPKDGLRTVSVRVDSGNAPKAGLTGPVSIESK
jgi:hypothetical protein